MIGTELSRQQLKDTRIMLPVDELKVWESNPRAIEKHDFERLKKRIAGVQIKPLLVLYSPNPTLNGTVLGGNMRIRGYKEQGRDKVWVSIVEFDDVGSRVYAYINGEQDMDEQGVYRSFSSIEDGMLHYALTDNEEFGHYLDQELAELIQPSELELDMYTVHIDRPKTLLDIQNEFGPGGEDIVEDEAPEVSQEPAISKLGEVYQLGRHRLMCGDSTKIEDVEKLMNGQKADMVFTDPPYGLGGYGGRNNMELKGDDKDVKPFYACIPYEVGEVYVWGNWKNLREDLPYAPRDVIIWRKNNFGLGAGYRGQYEMCFYFGKFDGSDSDIWDVSKDTNYQHPTQKPVELSARATKNSSKQDDIVLDLFGGSGSTLIACEQLNRTCYMMELDPKYCDVIRKRYAKFIGKEDAWEQLTASTSNDIQELVSLV